jgi:hypothetical protein
VQTCAQLGGLPQRVEQLLTTAAPFLLGAEARQGLHEVSVPPGANRHLTYR